MAPYGTLSDPKKPIKVPKIRIFGPKLRIFCDLRGSCGPRGHLMGAKHILPNLCIQTISQEVWGHFPEGGSENPPPCNVGLNKT